MSEPQEPKLEHRFRQATTHMLFTHVSVKSTVQDASLLTLPYQPVLYRAQKKYLFKVESSLFLNLCFCIYRGENLNLEQ